MNASELDQPRADTEDPISDVSWLIKGNHESQIIWGVSEFPWKYKVERKAKTLGSKRVKDKLMDCKNPLSLFLLKNNKNKKGNAMNAKTSWLRIINTARILSIIIFIDIDKLSLLYIHKMEIKKQIKRKSFLIGLAMIFPPRKKHNGKIYKE